MKRVLRSVFPDPRLAEPADQAGWGTIKIISISIAVFSSILIFSILIEIQFQGYSPTFNPSTWFPIPWPNIKPSMARLEDVFAILLSSVLGILVFMWSWLSHTTNRESREILERSWPGRQVIFHSIGEHIEEFAKEMSAGNAGDIVHVQLMLSTLMYGIQDKNDAPKYIGKLTSALQSWINEVGKDQDKTFYLKIGLWREAVHSKIWSIQEKNEGSDWYRKKSQKEIADYLIAMRDLCDVFKSLKNDNRSVILEVVQVFKNDFRFFIIKRNDKTSFAMVVLFTPFIAETVFGREYRSTGFVTNSTAGAREIESMFNQFNSAVKYSPDGTEGEYDKDGTLSADFLKGTPHQYVTKYFGICKETLGLENEWYEDISATAKAIYEFTNNVSTFPELRKNGE